MRVTRDILVRIARETAQKRAFSDPGLVGAYLTGSLKTENPLLGGATDIDIVFIHSRMPVKRRELVALTPEIHLDIIHNPRSDYEKPKDLRIDPWFGPELYDPIPLAVGEGFFEFIQAGVRDRFNEPASILARARNSYVHAREIWTGLESDQATDPQHLLAYLKSIRLAANALSLLNNDPPLPERRFLLLFPQKAESVGRPDLTIELLSLLGSKDMDLELMPACLEAWEKDFIEAAGRKRGDYRISISRLAYYKNAIYEILAAEFPYALLFPLILTWTLSASALPPTRQTSWKKNCAELILGGKSFKERIIALDHFLDNIETIIDSKQEW